MNIWLIGATNVGKSTLFNRLIGQFRAIVTDIPGTTTDIINHKMQLDTGDVLTFFDSPGLLDFTDEVPYIEWIIQHSDLLLFMIDDTVGITAKEQHILDLIRKEKKQDQTFLIVNKLDLKRKESDTELAISDYYTFWFKQVIWVSAKTERNLLEIHDQIETFLKERKNTNPTANLNAWEIENLDKEKTKIAILGKPNAGKSTLLNTLVSKSLAKVSDIAGTTRDYLVWEFTYKGKDYIAYDTAGIKKKSQIHGIEKIAYDKTNSMLEYLRPIVIFMIDCTQGITHRDLTLLQEIHSLALPMIFVLNKVDLVNPKVINWMIANTQEHLSFAKYLPIVPMIAKDGSWIDEMMKMVNLLQKENQKRIQTRELNQTLQTEYLQRPPRFPKSKIAKILYATQIAVDAPTFVIFVNHKSRVNFSFKKRIENTIRRHFGFIWVPLVIKYKNRWESWMENDVQVSYDEKEANLYNADEETIGENSKNNNKPRNVVRTKAEIVHNNKWKRKWEKEQLETKPTNARTQWWEKTVKSVNGSKTAKKPVWADRRPPKRISKYTNTRNVKQGKIDDMFSDIYGKKKKK